MTTDVGGTLPVDVVIPAWGEVYLGLLPWALASASRARRRIVVTDAASVATVRAAAGADLVLARPAGGVAVARERGRREVDQPYVLFLDADDTLEPGALDRLVTLLDNDPAAVAASGIMRYQNGNGSWPPPTPARVACLPGGTAVLLFSNVLASVGACMIRAAAVPAATSLFPELEDEDWHAAIMLRAAGPVRFTAEPLLRYRTEAGSVSRQPRDRQALLLSRGALLGSAQRGARHRRRALVLLDAVADPIRRRRVEQVIGAWGQANPDSAPPTEPIG